MDAYVRESDLKDASVDAVDASSHGAPDDERRIVAGERARLGLAS
jgi:hypothetical protein